MNIVRLIAQTLNADELNIPKTSADAALTNGLNVVYFVAGMVAVLVIVIAGFMMVAGSSDPGTVTKAKNMILYSVVGLGVIILAVAITQFVVGRF